MQVLLRQSLEHQFREIDRRSRALVNCIPDEKLHWRPPCEPGGAPSSCGEHILRSAATVEQTCGGISANLWDDPFEWTLPESLPTSASVTKYISEVEATRARTFDLIREDSDLDKQIMTPSGQLETLFSVLIETLARASHHQGRAYATFRLFSEATLPHI